MPIPTNTPLNSIISRVIEGPGALYLHCEHLAQITPKPTDPGHSAMASPESMGWPKGMTNSSLTIDLENLIAEFEEDQDRLFIDPLENDMNAEGLSPETGNIVQPF